MKLDQVASSHKDEFYTPRYAIRPILPFLRPRSRIWCPFDTERSLYVSELRTAGHSVTHSHLWDGVDFFEADVPECDYIISNPPYTLKGEVLDRLFKIGKPFAMLLGIVGLFESQKRFEMFRDNDFEVLYFNRRVAYFESYDDEKPALNPPFSSVYICSGVLPRQICFAQIDKSDHRATVTHNNSEGESDE